MFQVSLSKLYYHTSCEHTLQERLFKYNDLEHRRARQFKEDLILEFVGFFCHPALKEIDVTKLGAS